MADGHGGAREGAGRKPHAERYAQEIETFADLAASDIEKNYSNLRRLADGGGEVAEEEWEAAGTVTIGKGKDAKPAFPNLPPEQLVLVRRKVTHLPPERQANEYLTNRVMGKPTEHQEVTGKDGGPIEVAELTDEERMARINALAERARARRTG